MKKKSSRTLPPPLRTLLPAVLFAVACLLPAALPADWFLSRAWRGYYTVFAGPSARERLALLGSARVVSRQTATVSFNTFSGHQTVIVADLTGRLDPADPRRDPYLAGVGGYFQPRDGAGELAFLRTGRQPLVQLLWSIDRSIRSSDWQVLEIDPPALLLRLGFLVIAALFVLLPVRAPGVPRWLLVLGILPWGLRVASGDVRDLLAFILLFPLWVRGMAAVAERFAGAGRAPKGKTRTTSQSRRPRKRRRKSWWRRIEWRVALPAAGLVLLGLAVLLLAAPGGRHLAGTGCALLADLCLAVLVPAAARWERSHRAHSLFRALPILEARNAGSRRQAPASAWMMPLALACLALVAASSLQLAAGRRGLSAPHLRHAEAPPAGSLAALELTAPGTGLPHLADYVAHRAFQECLSFNRPLRVPAPDERVYLSEYLQAKEGFVQTRRVIKRFPPEWLERTLRGSPVGSVGRLLADQGRAAAVEWVSEEAGSAELLPLPRAAAVVLFLLACLTAGVLSGTRSFAL